MTLEPLISVVQRAPRGAKAPLCLLVGAGCSASAGVPLAAALLKRLQERSPDVGSYREGITALSADERQAFLDPYLDSAKVNPAHLAIAQLLHEGVVRHVFTTNFDMLLPRACALLGEFPAISSVLPEPQELPDKALLYLHGQRTATPGRVRRAPLKALFSELSAHCTFVVVGYSGHDDPVFDALASLRHFPHGLYWVGHEDQPPLPHVGKRLLRPSKNAALLSGYDADRFFVSLVHQLGGFSNEFASELLEHPAATLETLSVGPALRTPPQPHPKALGTDLFDDLLQEADLVAQRAQHRGSHEADALFEAAFARYAEVLVLHPSRHETYVHWGMVLAEQAKLKTGADAERLLGEACQKYQRAAALSPADPKIEHLWGMTLSRRAQLTRGAASEALVKEAIVHLSNAEDKSPGTAAFFLACLCASRGDSTQVRLWLTRGKVAGTLPPRSTLEGIGALRPVIDQPWFSALFTP